jgi:alpha-ketoglutarate-dependent taurine dioxygenase
MNDPVFSQSVGKTILADSNQDLFSLNRQEVIDSFLNHKVLLFRGFETSNDLFCRFSEQYGCNFYNYQAGAYDREKVDQKETLLSVTGGKQKFRVPFHGEMYYKKIRPQMLWFYCETPPLNNGETTICDAAELFQNLSPRVQKRFVENEIQYIRNYTREQWEAIYQTKNLDHVKYVCKENDLVLTIQSDESIETIYTTRAVVEDTKTGTNLFINNILPVSAQQLARKKGSNVCFADGSKISIWTLFHLWRKSSSLEIKIPWQQGDIIMIDNTRVMHGRKKITDDQRNILARMSDFALT